MSGIHTSVYMHENFFLRNRERRNGVGCVGTWKGSGKR